MSFEIHHIRLLQGAVELLPEQMAVIGRPNPKVVVFPNYFLLVGEGKIVRDIKELPNIEEVLGGLKQVLREKLPPEIHLEPVHNFSDTRVFVTDSPICLARALLHPSHTGRRIASQYREVSENSVRIWQHYHWAPREFNAEVWVYPRPRDLEVAASWEPEWTFTIDLKLKASAPTTVVALFNQVIHEIVHIRPRRRRRGLPRPL